jgi:hypothetical protein
MSHPMTTLVEEMAKAMRELEAQQDDGVDCSCDQLAQAALEVVLKRLREPDEKMVDVMVCSGGLRLMPHEKRDILYNIATHLDQERSRE